MRTDRSRVGAEIAVDLAGTDSFPASDPPAWSPTHAGGPSARDAEEPPLLRDLDQSLRDDVHFLRERFDRDQLARSRFAALGLETSGRPGVVEGVRLGAEWAEGSVVLTAHLDDPASTAVLFAVAREVTPGTTSQTLRFAALRGSPARRACASYLEDLSRAGPPVLALVSLESLGIPLSRSGRVVVGGGGQEASRIREALASHGLGTRHRFFGASATSAARASLAREIPSVMVRDRYVPVEVDRIDFERLGHLVEALGAAMRSFPASPPA